MEGGVDDGSLDRSIKAENVGIERKGSPVLDFMSAGWTDEKHTLYLNSMEASFVDQLYNNEYHSMDLLGRSPRPQKYSSPSQFKVLRGGCWENLIFERSKSRVGNRNETRHLSGNPWIRHFRSYSSGKDVNAGTSQRSEDRKPTVQSTQQESWLPEKETACSQLSHQDLIDRSTEVSDQNFVDEEVEGAAESSRACKRKRSRSPVYNLLNDQVVPSGKSLPPPGPGDNKNDTRSSSKAMKITTGFKIKCGVLLPRK
ncbi:uncharacterized protein LOC109721207 [Ananas comosus]|uniref:Uncharacterized protein LOC109721207 n=2 Tax=Ananas comosus TaxID=4615 RepID=A0A199UPK2_ANACO|nr:uncharacterized protein LOC109721207 [Ananas comosus]OAY66679.1 hypothetical protein ACMD2_02130 [Ananas comosus]CAD1838065.1 unnamed protein product [Ananas comosus var. bracteatus]